MKNMILTTATLIEKYPDHVWIDISDIGEFEAKLSEQQLEDGDYYLSRVDLNQLCMVVIKKWLSEFFDLELRSIFPCTFGGKENLEYISKLVNGFALQVGKTRLVFIPSQSLDMDEVEIPQEWVDLPNWAADYYLPIQVDVEGGYLHLWSFISHRDLKGKARFDRVFRNYQISRSDAIENLDVLFAACELQSQGELTPARAKIDFLPKLTPADSGKLIEKLQQYRSSFSPRLEFPFEQLGAILNDRQYLQTYLFPKQKTESESSTIETNLESWIKNIFGDGWKLLVNYINPPEAVPALNSQKLLPKLTSVKKVSLATPDEIKAAIAKLYQQQTDVPIPQEIVGVEDLIPLLQNCKNDIIWWNAAEYLWTIQPDLSPSVTGICNLKTKFVDREIAMMVAMIPTPNLEIAVLVRLYRGDLRDGDWETHLPPGLQLSVRDDRGNNFLKDPDGTPIIATAGTDVKDSSIQLCFVADLEDRFSVCITLGSVEVTESFKLPQTCFT